VLFVDIRLEYVSLKGRVQSQWKALKKGGAKGNKACWSLVKYYLGSTSASPAGTSYPRVTEYAVEFSRSTLVIFVFLRLRFQTV
jgi:hypothetical protein